MPGDCFKRKLYTHHGTWQWQCNRTYGSILQYMLEPQGRSKRISWEVVEKTVIVCSWLRHIGTENEFAALCWTPEQLLSNSGCWATTIHLHTSRWIYELLPTQPSVSPPSQAQNDQPNHPFTLGLNFNSKTFRHSLQWKHFELRNQNDPWHISRILQYTFQNSFLRQPYCPGVIHLLFPLAFLQIFDSNAN